MRLFWLATGVGATVYIVYAHWPVWVVVLSVILDVYNILSYLKEN